MSGTPAFFSFPANLLEALWPILVLPEPGLILARLEFLARKPWLTWLTLEALFAAPSN
jgi:hypothetical protein